MTEWRCPGRLRKKAGFALLHQIDSVYLARSRCDWSCLCGTPDYNRHDFSIFNVSPNGGDDGHPNVGAGGYQSLRLNFISKTIHPKFLIS